MALFKMQYLFDSEVPIIYVQRLQGQFLRKAKIGKIKIDMHKNRPY